MAELVSIVYKPAGAPSATEGYLRVPLREAQLVRGHGIEGDAKGGGRRNLNIMSRETLEGLAAEGFATGPGEMGEQLVLAGLDLNALPHGSRIRIGESACVEIDKPRTPCAVFERHQGRPKDEAVGRVGVMAIVTVGGRIAVGDPVVVLEEEPALAI